jgi:energy-coupling factor transporter ATP-binding protein EcfA2
MSHRFNQLSAWRNMPIPNNEPETTDGSGAIASQHRLFISHAGADSQRAVELAERIEAAGLPVWIDKKHLEPGGPWLDQLENALTRETTAFAIYLTAAGAENWVRTEVRQALIRKVDAEREGGRYPFIPVIADSATDLEKLPPFARHHQGVFLDDETALQKLIAAVTERKAETIALVDEPFMGLEAFTAADSHLFFGREAETMELIDRLQRTNLLLVAGDSGSGKSSLVKAGLIPAFREGRFAPRLGKRPDPEMFHVVEMRPLGDPFDALITAISNAARGLDINAQLLDTAFARLRRQEPSALRDALREGAPPESRILLVFDQFEELWTQTPDAGRRPFLDGLLDVARDDDPSRRVVATMRRDYMALTGTHKAFGGRLEATVSGERLCVYNLRRMTDEGLRACIERPLALAGVQRDQARELADEILRDAGDQPGDLALIEMALSETWEKCGGHGRLIDAYRAIGRIEGAIRKAADEVFEALSPEEQQRAETIFMRLVRLGDTGGTTRRVARLDEFDRPTQDLARRLGSKEGKRLLVLGGGPATDETAELAHEQLTTQWPTYAGWLRDENGDRRATDKRTLDLLTGWQQRLLAVGATWRGLPRSTDRRMFQSLLKRHLHWLSEPERLLVQRSRVLAYAQRGLLTVAVTAGIGVAAWVYWDQAQRAADLER